MPAIWDEGFLNNSGFLQFISELADTAKAQ